MLFDYFADYFTDPASRPRTRYFCIKKKTVSGTAIDTNAAVARISQLPPRVPRSSTIWRVITVVSPELSIRNTKATKRSFHVHRNWKIAKDASAGKDSGRMILVKI